MASTGNYDSRLVLPAVERALGGDDLRLLDVPAATSSTCRRLSSTAP